MRTGIVVTKDVYWSKLIGILVIIILCSKLQAHYHNLIFKQYIEVLSPIVSQRFEQLLTNIHNQKLANFDLLKEYLREASALRPDDSNFIKLLALNHSINNPSFSIIRKRFDGYTKIEDDRDRMNELIQLRKAVRPEIFNDSLIDTINALSDITNGALTGLIADMQTKPKQAARHFVGNPAYGEWKQNADRQYIWTWDTKYQLFSDYYSGPYEYNQWYYQRGWSFYQDYIAPSSLSERQIKKNKKIFNRSLYLLEELTGLTEKEIKKMRTKTNQYFKPSKETLDAKPLTWNNCERSELTE